MSIYVPILRLLVDGKLRKAVNIMRLALEARLLVAVLICSSLTTRIRSRMRFLKRPWSTHTSGIRLDRVRDYSQGDR